MGHVEIALAAWNGRLEVGKAIVPDWPTRGVAIEGDFSGIQRFVLRPVTGAGGAARRLRARSFRVLALTRLAAAKVQERFARNGAGLFYAAGGRFLVVAQPNADWRERLASLQKELDEDLLREYRGELAFHVLAAEFGDGRIPVEQIGVAMGLRKMSPLGGALRGADGWGGIERFAFNSVDEGRCDGCGSTATVRGEMDKDEVELLCRTCIDDRELGKQLMASDVTALARSSHGPVSLLGERWRIAPTGEVKVPVISRAPLEKGRLADFDQLAERAVGRKYLGYLRIDADRIGEEFRKLDGDAYRTWGLSQLLDAAFSTGIDGLLRTRFPNLYSVYGGGDDLFLIGPWNDVLDFAAVWRGEFRKLSDNQLNFSAGVALAKPRQHILTKSEEAASALDEAKKPRDSIHALGVTIAWSVFEHVYGGAKQLAALHNTGMIKSSFLHDAVYLHDAYNNGDERWHSRLYYQIERNLSGQARDFAKSAFLSPGHLWRYAGFIVRYAMLCSRRETEADSTLQRK